MRIKQIAITSILLLGIIAFFSAKESLRKNEIIDDLNRDLDSLKSVIESKSEIKFDSTGIELENKITHVYNRFKYYNKNIGTNTVNKFVEVTNAFNLDSTKLLFDICISQICVESRVRQYDENGKLIESGGNAIGITQIVPTTAHHYLRNIIKKSEYQLFRELGATDFSFIKTQPRYSMDSLQRAEVKKWLANETNNMVLWGYIMRHNLNKRGYTIYQTLVAYNEGNGYLLECIDNGNSVAKHKYVSMIKKSMRLLNSRNV